MTVCSKATYVFALRTCLRSTVCARLLVLSSYLTRALHLSLWLIVAMVVSAGAVYWNDLVFKRVEFIHTYCHSSINMGCFFLCSLLIRRFIQVKEGDTSENGGIRSQLSQLFVAAFGPMPPQTLDQAGYEKIIALSLLFSVNTVVRTMSLRYGTPAFFQIMRALLPAVVMAVGMLYLKKTYSLRRQIAVTFVIIGVAVISCLGEISVFTAVGFVLAVAGTILEGLKDVAFGEMLTGELELHPVDLLRFVSPLAMVQYLFLSIFTGEMYEVWEDEHLWDSVVPLAMLWSSCVVSFISSICILQATKLTSPLTVCIALRLIFAILTVIQRKENTPLEIVTGTLIILAGCTYYFYVRELEKKEAKIEEETTEYPSPHGSVTALEHGSTRYRLLPLLKEQSTMDDQMHLVVETKVDDVTE